MRVEFQEYDLNLNGVTIHYAEGPATGTPLVLLHGGSARWQSNETLMPELAVEWHVYAPDFRGHGKSGRTPGFYRLQDYADDTIAFLQQSVRQPAYVFGHSLGGIVSLLVAAQYPSGVRAIAVGDAPLSGETWHTVLLESRERFRAWCDLAGGQRSMVELIEALKNSPVEVQGREGTVSMREAFSEESPVFAWLAANLYQNDPDMLEALLTRFESTVAGYVMERLLPAIQCPVLLLQADPAAGGLMTDQEVAQALLLLAKPSHVRLSGMSHVLHNERKEPVLEALQTFFRLW